jgi:tRNA threonylcarbamoyladenosine biosynthesis protein TsaB
MLIVGFDTSSKTGSLALCRAAGLPSMSLEQPSLELLEQVSLAGRMYSAELLPKLDGMLVRRGLTPQDLEGIVVASGPGSFTGLRVGLSTAKGLSESLEIKIAPVSVLEAMVDPDAGPYSLVTALDAQRGEVYVGEYRIDAGEICATCESLQKLHDFAVWLKSRNPAPTVYACDESLIEVLRSEFVPVKLVPRPDAAAFVRCGLKKFASEETVTADELDANYIRRSDAEIFSAPKLGIPQR